MNLKKTPRAIVIVFSIFLMLIVSTPDSDARTHTIQFGGSFFHSYNPDVLDVSVGDTIRWVGNGTSTFVAHSLQSDTIPVGAEAFGVIDTGTIFVYVVKQPGYYHYICTEHFFRENMAGSFTAAPESSVRSDLSNQFLTLDQNYPNPFSSQTTIHYSLKKAVHVKLMISTLDGKMVRELVETYQNAGNYEVNLDAGAFSEGIYFCKLFVGEVILSKKLTLLRRNYNDK